MLNTNKISIVYKSLMDEDVDELMLKDLAENFQSAKSLRQYLMMSPKFRMNNPEHSYRGSILNEPKLFIEIEAEKITFKSF